MYISHCLVWWNCGKNQLKRKKTSSKNSSAKNTIMGKAVQKKYYNGQGAKNKSLNQGSNKRDEFKTGCERITAQTQFSSVQ